MKQLSKKKEIANFKNALLKDKTFFVNYESK